MEIVGHLCELGVGLCEGLLEVEEVADGASDSQVHGPEFASQDFEALAPDLPLG